MKTKLLLLGLSMMVVVIDGYAQKSTTLTQPLVNSTETKGKVLKRKVAIARFSNETKYAKGLFYDKANDPLEKQAIDILSTKLAASGKFLLLERSDIDKVIGESKVNNDSAYAKIAADYIIIGSITEYGRKNIGSSGVFTATKSQIVQAAVSIRLIDVSTGLIIYSEEAKGEAETKTKSTLGVGSKADYDAALDDQAIAVAVSQLVENVINNCMEKPWRGYVLSNDQDGTIISGGKSQGIAVGDKFVVKQRGRKIKNPQTGITIEIPGKEIAKIEVTETGGDTPNTEFSFVKVIEGKIEGVLTNLYIQEDKK